MKNTPLTTILLAAFTALVVSGAVFLGDRLYPAPTASIQTLSSSASVSPLPPVTTQEETTVVHAVELSEPSVVSVIITKDLPILKRYYEEGPFGLRFPQYRQEGTQPQEIGGGTAFFVSNDGLLMTNRHVVEDSEASYTVLLNDGTRKEATVLARDPTNDIALLHIDGNGFPALHFSDEKPTLGQTVVAIGNALGEFRNTVSVGVISGLQRSITAGDRTGTSEQLSSIIQTDAAINPGNSGGPLLTTKGEVIGMNTAVAASAQNIGFAIPVQDLKRVLQSYEQYGRIVRPYIGIRYAPITEEIQKQNNLPYDYGVLVVRGDTATDLAVIPGSPADKAGIAENDIILEADGQKLTLETSLASIVQHKQPGDAVTLKIYHKGAVKDVTVKIEEWKE